MKQPLPKKYFPGCIAVIYYRKEDGYAVQMRKHFPYFDTWKEAHEYMLDKAEKKVNQMERDLASAKRHLARVQSMKNNGE
jgi:hypothetical protein